MPVTTGAYGEAVKGKNYFRHVLPPMLYEQEAILLFPAHHFRRSFQPRVDFLLCLPSSRKLLHRVLAWNRKILFGECCETRTSYEEPTLAKRRYDSLGVQLNYADAVR